MSSADEQESSRPRGRRTIFFALNVLLVGGLVALMVASIFYSAPIEYLRSMVGENLPLTIVALVTLTLVATVIAPITTVLIVPASAGFVGPVIAGAAAWLGWFLGSLIAFYIARRFGRPLLQRFVSLKKIEQYEAYVPERVSLLTLIFLRMIIPPDILSYTIGTISTMRWRPYILGTLIGLAPFAFIGAYAGDAFFTGEYLVLAALVAGGIVLYAGILYFVLRKR